MSLCEYIRNINSRSRICGQRAYLFLISIDYPLRVYTHLFYQLLYSADFVLGTISSALQILTCLILGAALEAQPYR